MKAALLFIFLFSSALAWSQTVSGRVTDSDNNPLPGANVYIQNTFSGGSTDTNGVFSFSYEEGDSLNLIIEFIGYEKVITPLHSIKQEQRVDVVLKESFNLLSAVTITAGTYGSGKVESTVVM